jgi:hypothetical protein
VMWGVLRSLKKSLNTEWCYDWVQVEMFLVRFFVLLRDLVATKLSTCSLVRDNIIPDVQLKLLNFFCLLQGKMGNSRVTVVQRAECAWIWSLCYNWVEVFLMHFCIVSFKR